MNSKLTILALLLAGSSICNAEGPKGERFAGQRPLPTVNFGQESTGRVLRVTDDIAPREGATTKKMKRRAPQADMSLFEGRTLYGSLSSSDEWQGLWMTEVPYGIYSYTVGSNPQPESHITDMIYEFKSAAWGRDTFYGIVPLNLMGILNGSRHIQIDTKNWVEKSNVMHDTSEGTYSLILCTMAYDQTDDTFYGYKYKEDLSGLDWVKVDKERSDFEMIAAYRGKTVVLTLAATPDGQMYYIDVEGDLYSVNKENGRTSLIGNTGVSPTAYDQCMVWDNKSGSFLWAALSDEGSVLYSVDPATAEAKKVMKFKHNEQFTSIYMTDSEAVPGAPAAAGRAQLKYNSNGSLDGMLTFTAPSKTFSGENLAEDPNLTVWLDGEIVKEGKVEAGSAVSIPMNLTEGNHYINITSDNEAGWSPMRYIYQYAGYDTPEKPGNAKLSFAENVNTVTWEAPAAGVNKGYVDFENLTYDIVRMPDNVTVASGLKATEYSEPTPAALQSYKYIVTANNNGHKSEGAETNHILCGDAFPVPYSQTFEDESIFNDFFKAVDNNGDGWTWRYGYSGEIRMDYVKNDANPSDSDDWLILPKVTLEKGVKYRYSMLMKNLTPSYPEDFEILVGTNPDDLSSFRSIKKETDFTEIASEYGDYTCDFTVEENGEYNIAVRYCSRYDQKSSLMMVRRVGIDKIGMAGAPAQVSEMKITPDADDKLEATISFKVPATDLVGEPISTVGRIIIKRDSEETPIYIVDNASAGEEISYTDKEVPGVGIHRYTVIPSNGAGEGESCTQESFVGIYEAPYMTDFSDKALSRALWTTEDNIGTDPDGWSGWKWDEIATGERYFSFYYYLTEPDKRDIWLFSPRFKMEDNTVYTIKYKGAFPNSDYYADITSQIAYGEGANSGAMTKIEDINGALMAQNYETILINEEGGRYNIGFGVEGSKASNYMIGNIDDFSLTRRASAFAPSVFYNYSSAPDANGELKATLEFNVPDRDYYRKKLSNDEALTVKIYQGKDATIPSYTVEAKPGERMKWVDEKALHGMNYYRITCENRYGCGEAVTDTIFVGRDKPEVVGNLNVRADKENANARISWSCPETGINGGIVLEGETKYNVYRYNISSNELTAIAENVEGNSYLIEEGNFDTQKMYYYAVSAVNSEGEGVATVTSIVLGKPYDLPFSESFANAGVSTQLWQAIPMVQGATSAGLDNPGSQSYNGCSGPQDNDGGCAYFYNGYQYEAMMGALLVSPKLRLNKDGENELSFWAYHYAEPSGYVGKGTLYIAASADDGQAEIITSIEVGGQKEEGWKEHKVNLDKYKGSNYMSVIFMGVTPGWQDVLYVDNIQVTSEGSGIWVPAAEGESETIYDLHGYRTNRSAIKKGEVVVKNGKKVLQGR